MVFDNLNFCFGFCILIFILFFYARNITKSLHLILQKVMHLILHEFVSEIVIFLIVFVIFVVSWYVMFSYYCIKLSSELRANSNCTRARVPRADVARRGWGLRHGRLCRHRLLRYLRCRRCFHLLYRLRYRCMSRTDVVVNICVMGNDIFFSNI